jgi:hypothetical protein
MLACFLRGSGFGDAHGFGLCRSRCRERRKWKFCEESRHWSVLFRSGDLWGVDRCHIRGRGCRFGCRWLPILSVNKDLLAPEWKSHAVRHIRHAGLPDRHLGAVGLSRRCKVEYDSKGGFGVPFTTTKNGRNGRSEPGDNLQIHSTHGEYQNPNNELEYRQWLRQISFN